MSGYEAASTPGSKSCSNNASGWHAAGEHEHAAPDVRLTEYFFQRNHHES